MSHCWNHYGSTGIVSKELLVLDGSQVVKPKMSVGQMTERPAAHQTDNATISYRPPGILTVLLEKSTG
jgi:hypothetical protein